MLTIKDKRLRIVCVVGPTSSGKSELAVLLAKKFNGEIISVDSRQIYKGMDIGTGKVEGKWVNNALDNNPKRVIQDVGAIINRPIKGRMISAPTQPHFLYKQIPHHCIDFVDPHRQYSVAQFKKQAEKAIKDITKRSKLPILCGGTGHWMDAVVYNQVLPEVEPNKKLRAELEKKSADELYNQLQKLDPERGKTIDPQNPRRLIRALEIILTTGKPVPQLQIKDEGLKMYNALWIGINPGMDILKVKIARRVHTWYKHHALEKEVRSLHDQKISWKRIESFGLEYKYTALYLQKQINHEEMISQTILSNTQYTKRQMTWFKRNKNIHWILNSNEAISLIKPFAKS